jgi:N utilization substance protein B
MKNSPSLSRKGARRHAFHLIFQFPFHAPLDTSTLAEAKALYYDDLDTSPTGRDAEYINRVVWGVLEKLVQLDGVIEKFLKGWVIDRINKVDLAILRLSIYEMLCEEDVPLGVAVNEAVNLAKEYGSEESPAFVNGVLGNISKEIREKTMEKKLG